jgi:hypothetical protein
VARDFAWSSFDKHATVGQHRYAIGKVNAGASTMNEVSYAACRLPPEIIQQAIWHYVRFTLSFPNVEDLLAERGVVVYETVRRWVNHLG